MKTKVLIVEDEFSIALDIRQRLEEMDYDVVDWAQNYEEALIKIVELSPQVVLMDINLNQDKDGIDTAKQIHKSFDIPVVFVTAFSDKATFDKAMEAIPMGYVTKPFKDEDLQHNIELALQRHKLFTIPKESILSIENSTENQTRNDFVFLKSKSQFEKVFFKDKFARIHRSYVVSIDAIKAIEDNLLLLNNNTSIPVSKSYKKEFMDKFKLFS